MNRNLEGSMSFPEPFEKSHDGTEQEMHNATVIYDPIAYLNILKVPFFEISEVPDIGCWMGTRE